MIEVFATDRMPDSMRDRPIRLQEEWLKLLQGEFEEPYMGELSEFLRQRRAMGAKLYPPASEIFRAFDETPPQAVRVVILGQDPYHNPGQAQGLCFSVNPDVAVPPSLANIYRELEADLGCRVPDHGCLLPWARQGVLLLNAVLTVEQNQPGAHQGRGWERFTDHVIETLSEGSSPRVFMLWGAQAQKKGRAIDSHRHLVLRSPHPSPLSAHRGFLGNRHFSQANAFLRSAGLSEIDWQIPDKSMLEEPAVS